MLVGSRAAVNESVGRAPCALSEIESLSRHARGLISRERFLRAEQLGDGGAPNVDGGRQLPGRYAVGCGCSEIGSGLWWLVIAVFGSLAASWRRRAERRH